MCTIPETLITKIDTIELKTPIDKRTVARKLLEKRVRDIKIPYYDHKYGAWTYLSIKDMRDFTGSFLYNVN